VALARYIAAKLLAGIVMVWAVATFTFFIVHSLPGSPVDAALAQKLAAGIPYEEAQQQIQAIYNFVPTDSLWSQYRSYLWRLLHGDLGQSISYGGVPVRSVILDNAPWTLSLAVVALLISFALGLAVGVLAAMKRNTATGNGLTLSGSFLHGIPTFITATLLFFIFTTKWPVFPYGDAYDINVTPGFSGPFIASVISHAILPLAAYVISGYGAWMLVTKSSVVSVLGDDFVVAAELRGITTGRKMRYIVRNAMLPLFTILALSAGYLFGGSLFIETIFNRQGLGALQFNSIGARDYPLMMGSFLVLTISVILVNILADLLYPIIDPRVRR
jgi:peptide/nickel transport system permease protein